MLLVRYGVCCVVLGAVAAGVVLSGVQFVYSGLRNRGYF